MGGRHRIESAPGWWAAIGRRCSELTRPVFAYVALFEPWARVTGIPARPSVRMIDAGTRMIGPRQPTEAITTTLQIGDVTLVMRRSVPATIVAGQRLVESWQIGESRTADRQVTG